MRWKYMDSSLRDKIQDKIDLKTTAGDMETKLDTAKIGEYLGGCVSTATVTFIAGHIPAAGNVYLNGCRETTW